MSLGAQIEAWSFRSSLGAQIEAWRLTLSLGAQIEAWRFRLSLVGFVRQVNQQLKTFAIWVFLFKYTVYRLKERQQ